MLTIASCNDHQLSLETLEKKWQEIIPNPGRTYKRSFQDKKYHLTWTAKYNYKRMLRRSIPRQETTTCPFCSASHSQKNVLATINLLTIYGNSYPIEPLHLLLFNNHHSIDPQLSDLLTIGHFLQAVPSLKILISNRQGSGASIPAHIHTHAFHMHLPIEDAQEKERLLDTGTIQVATLFYPAWTVSISYSQEDYPKLAKIIIDVINKFSVPFNITIIDSRIFLIPRAKEDPTVCQKLIDGVGSLETAGVYTTVTRDALMKLTLQTFHIGLEEASFAHDTTFQNNFLSYLINQIKKL